MKIMLVDDDVALMLEVIHEINPTLDCDVAGDGEEALRMLERGFIPALIFLDINMPKMDGRACLRAIRSRFQTVPIVVVSTSISPKDQLLCLELKADFIEKPGTYQSYFPIIRGFLDVLVNN
jgi:CheY-like chemotaxis protein